MKNKGGKKMFIQRLKIDSGNLICEKIVDEVTGKKCGLIMRKNGVKDGAQKWICNCGATISQVKQKGKGKPAKFADRKAKDKYHNALKAAKRKQQKESKS